MNAQGHVDVIRVVYDIASAVGIEAAAEVLTGEQSSGTFTTVQRETEELRRAHRARVVGIDLKEGPVAMPLPGTRGEWSNAVRAHVTVEIPLANPGPSLPTLLSTIAGNLFEIRELGAVKIIDVDLPSAFAAEYAGPQFGVKGTRALMSRDGGVLLGTIVKPSVGLTAEELGALVAEVAEAGIDFIKDDELQANSPTMPLRTRVNAVMPVLHSIADRTGRMPMYAFNITDDIENLRRNHDLVVEAGGTCVMVVVNSVGLSGVDYLRRHASLPIHGHRAGFGALSRSAQLGWSFRAFQKLARLAGVDHLHTNGISNKFYESDDDVLEAIRDVRAPLFGGYETLPVLSSGQSAGLAHATYSATGTEDLLVLAGGGIHGHPMGAAAGVRSMREAWAAAVEGEPLVERARTVPELAAALETFGSRDAGQFAEAGA